MGAISVTATNSITGSGKTAVTTKLATPISAEFNYNLGANLDEAVSLHGADTVFAFFNRGATVAVQNIARTGLEHGRTVEAIQADLNSFKLGTARPRTAASIDPVAAFQARFMAMSPEEQKAAIAELRAKAAAGNAG